MVQPIVCKFGGTSMADAQHFRQVKAILTSDPARRFVVPSAPGKRFSGDTKVTDLLYACHRHALAGEPYDQEFSCIRQRFLDIAAELSLLESAVSSLQEELSKVFTNIALYKNPDYTASRGEYLCARVLAAYLGWEFIDAADLICFDKTGAFAADWTDTVARKRLSEVAHGVIPGFYGAFPDGSVRTFSRGGSDISGAIIARATDAALYENWTDVSGFLMADPRIVQKPLPIEVLTYRELRELSYMGATVLHEDAVFPVRKAGIPTQIRNTNDPDAPGTTIVEGTSQPPQRVFTGFAGIRGLCILSIEKSMMNAELGFGRRVLSALEENGVSFEHLPTGIDTICVVCHERDFLPNRQRIIDRIQETCSPDAIELSTSQALIACVGRGMQGAPGSAARALTALAEAGINTRMIDMGSSELNLIIGVDEKDFETGIRAIYAAFA